MPSLTKDDHKIIYTVTHLTVTYDDTVKRYRRDVDALKELLTGIAKKDEWTADFEVDKKKHAIKRVKGLGFPVVDGHPGHVHSSGAWKYNIERTSSTVDRLVLESWSCAMKDAHFEHKDGKDTIKVNLEIKCDGRVLVDTH